MFRNTLRCAIVAPVALILLAALPAPSSVPTRAAQAVPPPHLGYGFNVWDQPNLVAALGFEWVKFFEEAGPPPTARLPYHVLYRVFVNGYTDPPTFQQHVRELVRAGRGKVDAYEIGNEPNLKGTGFWGEYDVDPEAYTRLLCDVYPVIKGEDPNAIVVSGGLAPVGRWPVTTKNVMDERFFAMRMFDWMKLLTGGRFCADAFGYHPHGFKYAPEQPLDQLDPSDNGNGFAFRGAEKMRDIMVQFGASDMPMWATEFGWIRDPGFDPWTADWPMGTTYSWCNEQREEDIAGFFWMEVTEQQQADYLVRAFQYADQNWPWMGPMFVWNLDMYHMGWSCAPHKFYSLYRATEDEQGLRQPTPAYAALRDMPKRSAWTGTSMQVVPGQVSLVGAWEEPRAVTRTVSIERGGMTPMTWTASLDGSAPPGLVISPTGGLAPSTVLVSADASLFAPSHITGTFVFSLYITAEPTTTVGSPFTLPVTLRVMERWERAYLPVVMKDHVGPTPPPPTTTTRFGVAFITSAEAPSGEARFQRATSTGAGMDRWPLYWPAVEPRPGYFMWDDSLHNVDRAVISDMEHGLQPLVILMNTPDFYATAGSLSAPKPRIGPPPWLKSGGLRPQDVSSISSAASPPAGLYESVFSDGTDTPDPGKAINPDNPWARFVYEAVNRYKPGGVLAQQQGWPADRGVWHWEIWNEEDYSGFWIGSAADYARLLKVAYLAARHSDPQAKIILGGLANFEKPTWLRQTLDVIQTYPDQDTGAWFFDGVAEHNYVRAWDTFKYLYQASQALKTYSITGKSLWVTESNVWSCGDDVITPPCFHEDGSPVPLRANLQEQAAFVIQSAAYATWINSVTPVDAIFHFQMYDDCNDPIPGTGWGGGLGLVRNAADAPCFNTLPYPNTPRPAYAAFQTAATYLRDVTPKWRARPGNQEWFSFYRSSTQERVLVMWARGYATETAVIAATGASARLVGPDGSSQTITPTDGAYWVTLPAATNNAFGDWSAPIGGRPYFLIEADPSGSGGVQP